MFDRSKLKASQIYEIQKWLENHSVDPVLRLAVFKDRQSDWRLDSIPQTVEMQDILLVKERITIKRNNREWLIYAALDTETAEPIMFSQPILLYS